MIDKDAGRATSMLYYTAHFKKIDDIADKHLRDSARRKAVVIARSWCAANREEVAAIRKSYHEKVAAINKAYCDSYEEAIQEICNQTNPER